MARVAPGAGLVANDARSDHSTSRSNRTSGFFPMGSIGGVMVTPPTINFRYPSPQSIRVACRDVAGGNGDLYAFDRALPRKRMAAAMLLFDMAGRVLLVKPVYKDYWDAPGGVVERNESPREAAHREVREELGLDRVPGALLCVD